MSQKTLFWLSGTALWLTLCVAGLFLMARYELTPGRQVEGPGRWPTQTGLLRQSGAYTMVLAIHPQCPCSRATLNELALAITHCPRLQTILLFVKPSEMKHGWVKSDLWQTAGRLERCSRIVDSNGALSKAFHAQNSGQANLYDPTGQLVYSGGLTGGRGHEGDNPGLTSVIATVNRDVIANKSYSVFGCPLLAERQNQN